MSIGYYSPAGNERITQLYNARDGNRFLYHDKEGDGKPRRLTVAITFTERLPGGEAARETKGSGVIVLKAKMGSCWFFAKTV
jgi:hypothetical protein